MRIMTTFNRIWKTKSFQKDFLGRQITSALQYTIQFDDGTVLSSRPFTRNGITDTEFNRWSARGKLLDTMFIRYGGHGGAFGYDEKSGLINTLVEDPVTRQKYIGGVDYHSNSTIGLANFSWLVKVPHYVRFSTDTEQNVFLASDTEGNVYSGRLSELKQAGELFKPVFHLNSYGMRVNPAGNENDGRFNTLQANGICYPYAFFTFGDANNSDPKLILAIDLRDNRQVFKHEVIPERDVKLRVPLDKKGHLEPEGIYYDRHARKLVVGFNKLEVWGIGRFGYRYPHSELYETAKFNHRLPDILAM